MSGAEQRAWPLLVGIAVVLGSTASVLLPALVGPIIVAAAVVLAAPLLRRVVESAAWLLPVLIGIAVLLADTGGRTLAPGPWRYVATVAVLATVLLVGVAPDRRSAGLRWFAAALFAYGLIGTLYGRFVLGTVNGTLPLVGPMLIACLPPVRNWAPVAEWRTPLRLLSAACAVFAVASGLARLRYLPETQLDVLNHEKAFLVVMGIAAALAARDRLLVVASVAGAAFAFAAYPAATYLVAAAAALGTVVLVRWGPGAGLRVWLGLGVAAVVGAAVLNIDRLIAWTNVYFRLVGKTDNGDTREALYAAALRQLDSPVFSTFFSGDITVVGNLSGTERVVPVHNDYLSVTLGGGLVAGALLLAVFLLANGVVLRTVAAGVPVDQRRAVVVLLAGLNAAAVSAFANPIFMNPGSSAMTWALLAALVAACRTAPPPSELLPAVESEALQV